MTETDKITQGRAGFRRVGSWLLGIGWMITLGIGMTTAFSGEGTSRITGWMFLLLASLIFILTMDRWIKVLPALLAYGVIGGALATISGHALNSSKMPLSLAEGIALTLFLAASAVVSYSFTNRELRPFDRVALIAFVAFFFWDVFRDRVSFIGLGSSFLFLLLAWALNEFFQSVHSRRGS